MKFLHCNAPIATKLAMHLNMVLNNDAHKIWDEDNLCTSNDAIFVATGVCDGWIPGVQYNDDSANTWSRIIFVETGEIKTIESVHSLK